MSDTVMDTTSGWVWIEGVPPDEAPDTSSSLVIFEV